jgi:hypothetical protein
MTGLHLSIVRCVAVTDEALLWLRRTAESSLWPIRNSWNRSTENLYSAWIAKLFDAAISVRRRRFLGAYDNVMRGASARPMIARKGRVPCPRARRGHFDVPEIRWSALPVV